MIDFTKLTIKNFCSILDQELDLTVPGVVLVLGENHDDVQADSNGSGKSLIFEAFCWSLWGETVRELSNDEVVNNKIKKNCVVAIEFISNGNTYKVIRHQANKQHHKENDLEVFINGTSVTRESIKATQALVTEVIGLDFTSFCYLMPGAKVKVSQLTDKGFKELLEAFTKLHLFDRAFEHTKNELKDIASKVDFTQKLEENSFNSLVRLKEDLEKHEAVAAQFEESKQAQLRALDDSLKELDVQDIHIMEDMHAHLKASYKAADAYYLELTNKTIDMGVEYSNKILALGALKNKHVTLKDTAEASIKRLNSVGPECSHCFQVVGEEHKNTIKHELLKEFNKHSSSIKKIEKAAATLSEEQKLAHEEHNKEVHAQKKICSDFSAAVNEGNTKLSVERAKIREAARLEEYKESVASQTNHHLALIESTKEKILFTEKKTNELTASLKSFQAQQETLQFWYEAFSPKGLRSQVLKKVTPFINKRLDYYCTQLTNGSMSVSIYTERKLKNGNTKDDFGIDTKFKYGSQTYKGCSEGEKARVDLVLSLALADLVSSWISVYTPIRFYDEAFEKVDHTGLSAIVNLLKKDAEKYKTIFVITHNRDLKEFFDQQLVVTKLNGASTMKYGAN